MAVVRWRCWEGARRRCGGAGWLARRSVAVWWQGVSGGGNGGEGIQEEGRKGVRRRGGDGAVAVAGRGGKGQRWSEGKKREEKGKKKKKEGVWWSWLGGRHWCGGQGWLAAAMGAEEGGRENRGGWGRRVGHDGGRVLRHWG
nr:transcription elongation factor SPT6 homolog [Arachis hypogaea]